MTRLVNSGFGIGLPLAIIHVSARLRTRSGYRRGRISWLIAAALCGWLTATAGAAEPENVTAVELPAASAQVQEPFGLAELEQLALQDNPTLRQAAANVEDARGRTIQSGLYPNPIIGYNGEQIGLRGRQAPGEQQGMFIDQIVVTGDKLQLNQAKFGQEMVMMRWQAKAQQYRVVNGVHMRFYQLLAMQRLIDIRVDLLKVADDIAATAEELRNVGQANRPDVLQARVEARQERIGLQNARAMYAAAWQQLAAFIGNPNLVPSRLRGNLESTSELPDFEITVDHLLNASPEIQIARAEVQRNRFGVQRERVEPTPNIQFRTATGYNFSDEARSVTTSVNVGLRLPLFDKNQGNIHSAESQLTRSQLELDRINLSLRQRLAREYARYRTARTVVEEYRTGVLPEAREAFQLYRESFGQRRAAYPQVLIAQRNYFQINADYIEALNDMRRSEVAILGLLLVDGLDEPPGPPGESRIQRREGEADLPDPIQSGRGRSVDDRIGN